MLIRDVLSRIRIFSFSISDPGSASKNLSILTPKIVSKLSEIWSGLFIPDPDQCCGTGTGTVRTVTFCLVEPEPYLKKSEPEP